MTVSTENLRSKETYFIKACAADTALCMPTVASLCRICLWRLESSTMSWSIMPILPGCRLRWIVMHDSAVSHQNQQRRGIGEQDIPGRLRRRLRRTRPVILIGLCWVFQSDVYCILCEKTYLAAQTHRVSFVVHIVGSRRDLIDLA